MLPVELRYRLNDGSLMPTNKILVTAAVVLSVTGILLVCEVIRPFRDLPKDGPLALILWAVGATIGFLCLFRKERSVAIGVVALVLNLVPLLGVLGLLWLISKSNFAWH